MPSALLSGVDPKEARARIVMPEPSAVRGAEGVERVDARVDPALRLRHRARLPALDAAPVLPHAGISHAATERESCPEGTSGWAEAASDSSRESTVR